MPAPTTWSLIEADARERRLFGDLESTLALPSTPAAPRNARREVRRIEAEGGVWFLKAFARIQLKNALKVRCTAPRARDEASREAAMVDALARAGVAAPRVVAIGRRGRSSYFLCAALPGTDLRARLARAPSPGLLLAAARFAGSVLAHGFRLPDLSAEHVFVDEAAGALSFAVLDLHNASVGRPNPQSLRRALRHSARSLRGLTLPRGAALRAALALLRPNCARARRRALIAQLPPWDTHSRYGVPGKSDAYAQRNPTRTARELELLARVWPGQPGETVLDNPCGAGRAWSWLADRGHRILGSDRARAMLQTAGDRQPRVCADATALPFADAEVDGVLQFRFLHHLPEPVARRAVEEAARVARRWLVVSVFHPVAMHALARRLRGMLGARAKTRYSLAPARVTAWLASRGFEPVAQAREGALRELCVLSFRRAAAEH